MKKKTNSILAGLVFAVLAVFLAVEGAEAFCVYNHTDKQIRVEQVSGGSSFLGVFHHYIDPGGKECCNWQEKSCNTGGKRDSTVTFDVRYTVEVRAEPTVMAICINFPIKAGGWLTVSGTKGNYKCEAHYQE